MTNRRKKKNFVAYLQNIEKDKLYYYVLAAENKNKVLVVRGPSGQVSTKLQRQYLGYSWSSAKGKEGISYLNSSRKSEDEDEQNESNIAFDDKEDQRILKKFE